MTRRAWGRRRKAWTIIAAGLGAWGCVIALAYVVCIIVLAPGCGAEVALGLIR